VNVLSTIRLHYSELFGLGANGQGFVVEVDFQLKFSFLVDMEDCRHHFVVLSFNFQVWRHLHSRHVFI